MSNLNYTTGNPNNLTAGASASMTDIQGPFTDIKTFLNNANLTDSNVSAAGLSLAKLVPLILYGIVNGNTGAIFTAGSGGWTSARSGTGLYTLTFSPAFSSGPIVVPAAFTAGSAEVAVVSAITGSGATITTNLTTTGAGADANFTFIAIGPR